MFAIENLKKPERVLPYYRTPVRRSRTQHSAQDKNISTTESGTIPSFLNVGQNLCVTDRLTYSAIASKLNTSHVETRAELIEGITRLGMENPGRSP